MESLPHLDECFLGGILYTLMAWWSGTFLSTGISYPKFESWLLALPVGWLWANYVSFYGDSFLRVCYEDQEIVTEKSKFWLFHPRSVSLILTLGFLFVCLFCFVLLILLLYIMACLRESCPLPDCKLKRLCWEDFPPVDGRKKETNTSPCLKLAVLGDICKIKWPYCFVFSYTPHLWSIKEPGVKTPTRQLFWDISLPSS